jgi:outer membrane protein, heavy metal efflux system
MLGRLTSSLLALSLALRLGGAEAQEPLPPRLPDAMQRGPVGREYLPPPPMPASPPTMQYQQKLSVGVAKAGCESFALDVLLSLAMQNNPTLRQARAHVSAELGKALEAGLYPNPLLQYSGDLIGVPNDARVRTPGEFQGGIVQQEIITGGKLELSRQKYMQRARISEHLAVAQQYRC